MELIIRKYTETDVPDMLPVWNQVVEEANAFPQSEPLTVEEGKTFFASQTYTGVAQKDGKLVGLYILHPNNVGRCGHIANASYAVAEGRRGEHIGEGLVRHSMETAQKSGFSILQFNAVVKSNQAAVHLYERLGFIRAGLIPGGYRLKNGDFEDVFIYYIRISG